jgi:hypothetical protein
VVDDMPTREHLQQLARRLHPDFVSADPFPHMVIDDLLPESTLRTLIDSFPEPGPAWQHFDDPHQLKYALRDEESIPDPIRSVLRQFNAQVFVEFLETLTGITGLIPDPHLLGGGLHQIPRGGDPQGARGLRPAPPVEGRPSTQRPAPSQRGLARRLWRPPPAVGPGDDPYRGERGPHRQPDGGCSRRRPRPSTVTPTCSAFPKVGSAARWPGATTPPPPSNGWAATTRCGPADRTPLRPPPAIGSADWSLPSWSTPPARCGLPSGTDRAGRVAPDLGFPVCWA